MKIIDKMKQIEKEKSYNFCLMDFTLYGTDYFRIYDKVDGICLYTNRIMNIDSFPKELTEKEIKKEELIKLERESASSRCPFAVCFYLDAPKKVEGGISNKARYV